MSVELPYNDPIVDSTATDNLVVVTTKSGNAYRYGIDPNNTQWSPVQIPLNNEKVQQIVSHGPVMGVRTASRP